MQRQIGVKMKGLLLSVIIFGAFGIGQMSHANDSSSGCGMGWMVFKKNSLVSSWFRAMTNATFSSTIGMTSGTSGCAQHSIVKNDSKGLHYTEANYHQLMVEMSAGDGEFLRTYSRVLGCPENSYGIFSKTLQSNYNEIFNGSVEQTPRDVLNNVIHQLKAEKSGKISCSSFAVI
jgi:hypothetical protein